MNPHSNRGWSIGRLFNYANNTLTIAGVILTTVTDVVGFFAFLGLAAWWFGLG